MFAFRDIRKTAGKTAQEPGKELQKLKRQDLLELLLEQMREADRLRSELSLVKDKEAGVSDLAESLRTILDDREAQLEQLKTRLADEDAALQQAFAIIRKMAGTTRESDRIALQLQAENILADRYISQNEAPAQAPEATKDLAAANPLAAMCAKVPTVYPAVEPAPEAAAPQPQRVDHLYTEPEPVHAAVHFANSGEVR